MHSAEPKKQFVVLLLVIAFLGAQVHFCTDMMDAQATSHVCPICSAADSAAPAVAPHIAMLVPVQIVELHASISPVRPAFAHLLPLRAPPAR